MPKTKETPLHVEISKGGSLDGCPVLVEPPQKGRIIAYVKDGKFTICEGLWSVSAELVRQLLDAAQSERP